MTTPVSRADKFVALTRSIFEGEDEVILTHLIADLIEWCDVKRIDFDLQVEAAREMLLECQCAGSKR